MITQAWERRRRDQLLISCAVHEAAAVRAGYLRGMRQPLVLDVFAGMSAKPSPEAALTVNFLKMPEHRTGVRPRFQFRALLVRQQSNGRDISFFCSPLSFRPGRFQPCARGRTGMSAGWFFFRDGASPDFTLRILATRQAVVSNFLAKKPKPQLDATRLRDLKPHRLDASRPCDLKPQLDSERTHTVIPTTKLTSTELDRSL